ncbi:hypothetical protein [Polynucleobacter antarcticus]|nr:hypothetical protein [Polynucleobacter antarcticus]
MINILNTIKNLLCDLEIKIHGTAKEIEKVGGISDISKNIRGCGDLVSIEIKKIKEKKIENFP